MDQVTVPFTVENIDISDDGEPMLYIQRYHYPARSYRVVSKEIPVSPGETFTANPAYQEKFWLNNPLLLNDEPFIPEDGIETEVIAYVDRDEEHPPVDHPGDINGQDSDPCFLVTYDHEERMYLCEFTGVYGNDLAEKTVVQQDEDALGRITGETLIETLSQGVAALNRLIEHALMN